MSNAENLIDGPRRPAASGETDSLIILAHGYGANGPDLFGLSDPLAQVLPNTAFASPNAQQRCPFAPGGYQWFPIPWIDGSSEEAMRAGFIEAQAALNSFIDAELARYGLSEERLMLVGFSQGTMMSLHVGPRREKPLAGVIGFSGRLVDAEALTEGVKNRPPIFLAHGDQDDVIPVEDLHKTREALAQDGFSVRWHISPGVPHGIGPDGLSLAAKFAQQVLTETSSN